MAYKIERSNLGNNALPAADGVDRGAGQRLDLYGGQLGDHGRRGARDGTVAKLFYQDATLLGTDTTSPYSYSWRAATGTYTLTAKAYDNLGAIATGAAVTVKRGTGGDAVGERRLGGGAGDGHRAVPDLADEFDGCGADGEVRHERDGDQRDGLRCALRHGGHPRRRGRDASVHVTPVDDTLAKPRSRSS